MLKLERKQKDTISIEDIVRKVITGNSVMVFYYTSNKNYPVFLKNNDCKWGFVSPVINNNASYERMDLTDCLKDASNDRDIFVIDYRDWRELFVQRDNSNDDSEY